MHSTNNADIHNTMNNYKVHMNYTCVQGSQYKQDLDNFEQKYEKEKYSYSIDSFMDFLVNEKKLTHEYYLHFKNYFNGLYSTGIINQVDFNIYIASLNFYLAKNEYSFDITAKKGVVDYTINNFYKDNQNQGIRNAIFTDIQNKGAAVWLSSTGKICIRFSVNTEHKEYSLKQASMILSNFMSISIEFTEDNPPDDTAESGKIYIRITDLLLVQGEKFNTNKDSEFFEVDGLWYRNTFKPSKPLQLNQQPKKVPINIFSLIMHLVNYDIVRFFIFINWLAYFFQFLKKSQVAILFKGQQGAGKGTFWKIIENLFGHTYCKQINGDSLKSNYLGSFIENTLFLNFDEISYKTIGKGSFSSFLKGIITNDEVTSEKKGVNMAKPTKAHAQTILFSNADNPIEIEPSDRRFIVLSTAGNIKETNFFGHGDFDSFEKAIHDEHEDFAMYLKLFKVDVKQANIVFETKEKELMVNRTENNLRWFVDAILTNNLQYFLVLQNTNLFLYNIFLKQLFKYRVFQKHLILVYTALYPEDKHIESATLLIKHIERIAPHVFGNHNIKKTNGDKYYNLMVEDIIDPMPIISKFKQ